MFKRGLNAAECTAEMFSAFGKLAPTKTTVYKWYSRFSLGYMCLLLLTETEIEIQLKQFLSFFRTETETEMYCYFLLKTEKI